MQPFKKMERHIKKYNCYIGNCFHQIKHMNTHVYLDISWFYNLKKNIFIYNFYIF